MGKKVSSGFQALLLLLWNCCPWFKIAIYFFVF